ncbi:MAG: hypothetical protein A3E88_01930 [Legionellales bacterium RIFCSPHIGHO2_12_FULL_35_11]|nr:MAG: hypothetical protein A3E88_01930 [Legionellales bacterium RIFCSPHIGHO2_12_FULL_35_11]
MKNLILHPTDISQWYALVNEAQAASQLALNENTESYLVFLLQRFSQNPQLTESVVAIDFLESMHLDGKKQVEKLKTVGDKSLLLSGLFPGIIDKRNLSIEYYTDMGKLAYLSASELQKNAAADLYLELSQHFLNLQCVLQAMRGEFYQFGCEDNNATKFSDDSNLH